MYSPETVHRYPRMITWSIEILCMLIVVLSLVNLGIALLHYAWDTIGLDPTLFSRIPLLPEVVVWIDGTTARARMLEPIALLPALGWAAVALLLAILLRNAFPIVRTGSQGVLVEFAGDWLPIPWDKLRAIKVTGDLAGERFVLLVQAERPRLTTWHRCYSLLYRLGWRRGFLITSNISNFDKLVQTMLSETDRTARLSEQGQALRLEEDAPSPLFRFLLGPAAFFSRRAPAEVAAASAGPAIAGEPVQGDYTARINTLLNAGIILVAVLALWQYLFTWIKFLALEIPALRGFAPFSWVFTQEAYAQLAAAFRTRPVPFFGVGAPDLPAPWWLLVSAHLNLLLVIGALLVLSSLLPALEARSEGLAIRDRFRRQWRLLPWTQIVTFKATEFSEESQVLLIQARGAALPLHYRFNSLLYDGSFKPGLIVTSAIGNFQPLLHRALLETTHTQSVAPPRPTDPPLLQQEARSWLLWLAFQARAALEELVNQVRADSTTLAAHPANLLRAAGPMVWLALPPALILLIDGLLLRGAAPDLGLVVSAFMLWLVAMLEWPLACLLVMVLDDATGGGEEGYRAFAIYPFVQLPRLLPLLGALLLLALGVPLLLLMVAWIGAILWSFRLAARLWETLYGWQGSQALLGGLIPVVWQLLVLLVYLLVQR